MKKITLVYGHVHPKEQIADAYRYVSRYIDECNRLLKEKGVRYELVVKLLQYEKEIKNNRHIPEEWYYEQLETMRKKGEPADLIRINTGYGSNPSKTEAIERKLIQPMTAFFETKKGRQLYHSYPQTAIDFLRVGKEYYYIPIQLYSIDGNDNKEQRFVSLDLDIANRYGIDVHTWDHKLWEKKADLDVLAKATREGKFRLVNTTLYFLFSNAYELTPIVNLSFSHSPYALDETSETIVNVYEDENFQQMLRLLQGYYKEGYIDMSTDGSSEFLNFLEIEEKAYKRIMMKAYANILSPAGLAISSWTTQKSDVENFLSIAYTDADISSALGYGKKGAHYFEIDGKAYITNSKESEGVVNIGLGNPFIVPLTAYNKIHKNKKELFDSVNKYPRSKAYGFTFDDSFVKEEMRAIASTYNDVDLQSSEILMLLDDQEQIQKLNAVGMQKVLKEMNRQFALFLKSKKEGN